MTLMMEELQNSESFGEVTCGTNDVLTQALGTQEQRGHVRGIGKYVRPHQHFYLPKTVKNYLDSENQKYDKRFNKIEGELEKLKRGVNNASEGASCQMWDKDYYENNPLEELLDTSCYLAVDVASNIVAKGTIMKPSVSGEIKEIKNGPKKDHGFCFVSLSAISRSGRKAKFKNSDEASRSIADWLSIRKENHIILVPYNPGRHWVLAVIDMEATTCYYLDSLRASNVNPQLKQIIDAEMVLYVAQSGSDKRVKLNWINVLCPCQPGDTECGYYVCKFMKEIVDKGVEVLVNKNVGDGKKNYTDDDIDDVREEWASFASKFIFR